ncbi:MAG: response regulator [Parasphingopyxis sp.]|uniref:response regulator n=2 Tax=Parasphingopyxis TaxID=1234545 RepID=UPI0032EB91CB
MTNEPARGNGEMILLVEDQKEVGDIAEDMLDALGYNVLRAADATEALSIIEERGDIDLLLTDIVMPGSMNGTDLAMKAREESGLRAVLVTGYADKAIPSDQFERFDVLLKPFRMDELGQRIRAALDAEKRAGAD